MSEPLLVNFPPEDAEAQARPAAQDDALLRSAVQKVQWNLLPMLSLLFFLSYVDRGNVSFAVTPMEKDLGLTDATYGFGAGLFFVAYSVFQVPANLLMVHMGARRWLGLISALWGIVSAMFGILTAAWQFPVFRVILGLSEAGLAIGIYMYFTYWFPPADRALALSRFMLAAPLSSAIGAPISEYILKEWGWRWMFIAEAIPVLVVGIWVLFYLPRSPEDVDWLSQAQKLALAAQVAPVPDHDMIDSRQCLAKSCQARKVVRALKSSNFCVVTKVLTMPRTWKLGALHFSIDMLLYGVSMWLPKTLERCVSEHWKVACGVALPYMCAAIFMYASSQPNLSARALRLRASMGMLCGATSLVLGAILMYFSPWFCYIGMAISAPCTFFAGPPLIVYGANDFEARLGKDEAAGRAVGLGALNAIGHFGAFFGPYLFGILETWSRSIGVASLAVPAILVASLWAVFGQEKPLEEQDLAEAPEEEEFIASTSYLPLVEAVEAEEFVASSICHPVVEALEADIPKHPDAEKGRCDNGIALPSGGWEFHSEVVPYFSGPSDEAAKGQGAVLNHKEKDGAQDPAAANESLQARSQLQLGRPGQQSMETFLRNRLGGFDILTYASQLIRGWSTAWASAHSTTGGLSTTWASAQSTMGQLTHPRTTAACLLAARALEKIFSVASGESSWEGDLEKMVAEWCMHHAQKVDAFTAWASRENWSARNKAYLDCCVANGWDAEDAVIVGMLKLHIYSEPMARALQMRDAGYASATFKLTEVLVCNSCRQERRSGPAPKLYRNLRGEGSLIQGDSAWEALLYPCSIGYTSLVTSAMVSAINHDEAFHADGVMQLVGDRHVPQEGDVVCFESEISDDQSFLHSAIMTVRSEGVFPPNTLFTLKDIKEAGEWEAETTSGLQTVSQRLLIVTATFPAPTEEPVCALVADV